MIQENNKIEFYKFLNGEITIEEFENFIYEHKELQEQLDSETYFELINFNYKEKKSIDRLTDFIFQNVIEEGEFEAWKLKSLLINFLTDINNTHKYLDMFYHLYCGTYHKDGTRKYEYKFLSNLGLNYLYWIDEGYLKTNYAEKWKAEYEKALKDLVFYHQQLKPFAEEILEAMNSERIKILNNGMYQVTEELKLKLESDKIYKLEHPNK